MVLSPSRGFIATRQRESNVFTGLSVCLSTGEYPCDHYPWCIGLSCGKKNRLGTHLPAPGVTSGGGHWNCSTCGFQAVGTHPTGMLSWPNVILNVRTWSRVKSPGLSTHIMTCGKIWTSWITNRALNRHWPSLSNDGAEQPCGGNRRGGRKEECH